MSLIKGIELLYSEHYSLIGGKIFSYIIATIVVIFFIAAMYCLIRDKDWHLIWLPLFWLIFAGGICVLAIISAKPYTDYYVKIDDTVPYVEVINTYGEIYHVSNDVYKITIKD